MRATALYALLLLLGAGIGWAAHPSSEPHSAAGETSCPAVPAAPRPLVVTTSGGGIDTAALRQLVREAVREELNHAEPGAHEPTAEPPAPPSTDSEEARDKGLELVRAAHGTGRWTNGNVAELRKLLPSMTEAQRQEIFQTLLPALNRGELARDFTDSPF
jgi:hypothetical protein